MILNDSIDYSISFNEPRILSIIISSILQLNIPILPIFEAKLIEAEDCFWEWCFADDFENYSKGVICDKRCLIPKKNI